MLCLVTALAFSGSFCRSLDTLCLVTALAFSGSLCRCLCLMTAWPCGCPSFGWTPLPNCTHIPKSAFCCFLYILLPMHGNMPLGISLTFVWTQMPVFGNTTLDTLSTCIKVSAMVFPYTLCNRFPHCSYIHSCSTFIVQHTFANKMLFIKTVFLFDDSLMSVACSL